MVPAIHTLFTSVSPGNPYVACKVSHAISGPYLFPMEKCVCSHLSSCQYLSFSLYLHETSWEIDCLKYVWDGVSDKSAARTIYLATDDPDSIKEEISRLPMGQGGTTIVGGCERVRFVFSPHDENESLHLSEGGVGKVDCVERE